VAAVRPPPLPDRLREPGADGVLDDVSARRSQIALAVDCASGEAAGEERAEALVALVEGLAVVAQEPLEAARELGLRAVEHEVVMRRHQAERVQCPAVALGAETKSPEEGASVVVVAEDRAPVDAARGDVEIAVRE
jgi:hypothetical protein